MEVKNSNLLYSIILMVLLTPVMGSAKPQFKIGESPSPREILLENDDYRISVSIPPSIQESIIQIERKGGVQALRTLSPELTLFYSDHDPEYGFGHRVEGNSPVAFWGKSDNTEIWNVSEPLRAKPNHIAKENDRVIFRFGENDGFELELTLTLPGERGTPEFFWEMTALKEGYYSVGFTGLQDQRSEDLDFLYQPLTWSWKRFPMKPVLTPESYATTASVFTNSKGVTEGLAVPSKEIPYRFADYSNSRFGLMLRKENGLASPMVFAPILGGDGSLMAAGEKRTFTIQYYLHQGDWLEGTDYLYSQVLEYRVERQNAMVSLNETIHNMIDFAMDDYYSGWLETYKGYDYKFDVPNTVKNVSALHPLSVALTTGNKQIYERRGLPMLEYLMSREKYLYAINAEPKNQNQNPSHYLNGPAMELWEMASIHSLMGENNDVFPSEMERLFGQSRQLNLETEVSGATWKDYLARYLTEEDKSFLDSALRLADEYLELTFYNYPADYSTNAGLKDAQATFVNDYSTTWQELLELYELTGAEKYLDAAHEGAKQLALWTRSNPFAPEKNILVNKAGKVDGVFPGRRFKPDSYEWQEFDMTTEIQEQIVPAWHTSLVGLLPEQPGTYRYGPIMLFHQAGGLLRMAHLKKDTVLKDIAYNAILGRYNNFPGYYFTSLETNVYQHTNYPLHPYLDIKYNAVFYNHIWPHIALLQDFLISDAYYRSDGKIDFPSLFSPGYAFLSNKVYGHLPGKIYDHDNIQVWLPKDPFLTNEKALNYLLGRDGEDTYLILMNTENRTVEADLFFNPSIVKWDQGRVYACEIIGGSGVVKSTPVENGKLRVSVSPNGLTVYRVKGMKQQQSLQVRNLQSTKEKTIPDFVRVSKEEKPLGTLAGMIFQIGAGSKDLYVYSTATEEDVASATLEYKVGEGEWTTVLDDLYPFEFSIRLSDPGTKVEWKWKATDHKGLIHESETFQLQ